MQFPEMIANTNMISATLYEGVDQDDDEAVLRLFCKLGICHGT